MRKNARMLDAFMLITQLGLAVVISVFCGLGVGIWLDKRLSTKPIFSIVFLVFGVIGGFMSAYQLLRGSDNDRAGN